jgi:type IV secretory pathway VirB10-like protein
MIKNFEKVKGQLNDLADALNKFKSETVQLKLIELLFGNIDSEKPDEKAPDKAIAEPVVKRKRPGRPPKVVAEVESQPEKEPKAPKALKAPKAPKEPKAPKAPKAPKVPKTPKEKKKPEPRKRSSDRPGPSTALNQLLDTDFFGQKRTIGDIVNHFVAAFNSQYKSTDLSGTLAKLAKDGKLFREKNPETNQFEYTKG